MELYPWRLGSHLVGANDPIRPLPSLVTTELPKVTCPAYEAGLRRMQLDGEKRESGMESSLRMQKYLNSLSPEPSEKSEEQRIQEAINWYHEMRAKKEEE